MDERTILFLAEQAGVRGLMDRERPTPSDRVEPDTFLDRVSRLAKQPVRRDAFHRTRPPFTRLTDVAGRIRAGREARHPSHCQTVGCGASLTEGYYRRADGLTLCRTCFRAESGGEASPCDDP